MNKFIEKYGNPFIINDSDKTVINTVWQRKFEPLYMQLLKYPTHIKKSFPTIGESVYMNKDFIAIYLMFLNKLIERKLNTEITVNDQCFMVRMIRGSVSTPSIHSWGMAVDLNPNNNPLGLNREQCIAKGLIPFSENFQQTARDCKIVCGYDFKRCDGMHFEHSNW